MDPSSSLTISHNTPTGDDPAMRAKSTAASVCPARFSTPPARYLNGNTCPGLTNAAAVVSSDPSALIVIALSLADIPVVLVAKSTLTVNAVFIASLLLCESTISGRSSASALESSRLTHTNPLVCRIMNASDAAVILSAAPIKSPSFSLSSSSSTTTNFPFATSSSASATDANPGVGASGSSLAVARVPRAPPRGVARGVVAGVAREGLRVRA